MKRKTVKEMKRPTVLARGHDTGKNKLLPDEREREETKAGGRKERRWPRVEGRGPTEGSSFPWGEGRPTRGHSRFVVPTRPSGLRPGNGLES